MSYWDHLYNKKEKVVKEYTWYWTRCSGCPVHIKTFDKPLDIEDARKILREELELAPEDKLFVWTVLKY